MIIRLDEHGSALPDAYIEECAEAHLERRMDIHTSQMLMIHCLRSMLRQMLVQNRPEVKWIFYGTEVHYDKNLKSFDAYRHPLTNLEEKFLYELI